MVQRLVLAEDKITRFTGVCACFPFAGALAGRGVDLFRYLKLRDYSSIYGCRNIDLTKKGNQ